MDEVALAEGAARQELDRVDGAHVRLDRGDDLLVLRVRADFVQRDLRRLDSEREPWAHVPVELDDPLELLNSDWLVGQCLTNSIRSAV